MEPASQEALPFKSFMDWKLVAGVVAVFLLWAAAVTILWQFQLLALLFIVPAVFATGFFLQKFWFSPWGRVWLMNLMGKNLGIIVLKRASRRNAFHIADFTKPDFSLNGRTYMISEADVSFLGGVPTVEFEEGNAAPLPPLAKDEEVTVTGKAICPKCSEELDVKIPTKLPIRQSVSAEVMTAYLVRLWALLQALWFGRRELLLYLIAVGLVISVGLSLYQILFVIPGLESGFNAQVAGIHASLGVLNSTLAPQVQLPVV